MKNILSITIFALLFLGLGALALSAAPGGLDMIAGSAAQAPEVAEVSAPTAVKINEVALPLDVQSAFTTAGYPFNADGLAQNIASGETTVSQVSQWNESMQIFDTWDPVNNIGTIDGAFSLVAFPLATGEAYGLTVNSGASVVYSIVGDVPAIGAIQHTWTGAVSCKLNNFGIPLDQDPATSGKDLSNSDKLAEDIDPLPTEVSQVLSWNAAMQIYDSWDPTNNVGTVDGAFSLVPFNVKIGYPYWICAGAGLNGQQWP